METDLMNIIGSISTRDKMVRYLDGYAAERMEELDERKMKRPLTKSYLVEHACDSDKAKSIKDIMDSVSVPIEMIEEGLYRVRDHYDGEYFGFLETLSPRYFVIYTLYESQQSDRWIRNLILRCPELDHVWLSGLTFNVLWQRVVQLNNPNRYVKIMFQHDSIYQVDGETFESEEEETSTFPDESDIAEIIERRASKFSLVDRISIVKEKLSKLQELYSPLYAINQLRFPSPIGRGGHDFFDNGKVTNRSGNFRDHRSHIIYVQRIYDELMKVTESKAWYSIQKETVAIPGTFQRLVGAPLSIKFSDPLSQETLEYWLKSTFGRLRNRFRLWGNPIKLGPTKFHVYGIDRHLWQPIFMEITANHLIAIIPKGTCGNTVHRLVTNIQRYIDPAASVFVGDTKYEEMVEESSRGVKYERETSRTVQ
ncbi:MAG: hypothetical protein ABSH06_09050 [Thermodesulfobacteriota bacterium]